MPAPSFLSRALVGVAPPGTVPLQGLRVLSSMFVVAGHVGIFGVLMLDSAAPVQALANSYSIFGYLHHFIDLVVLSTVDVFFVISGFCLMVSLSKLHSDNLVSPLSHMRSRPRVLTQYMLSRYLRLAIPYLLPSLLFAALGADNCPRWSELLFMSHPNRLGLSPRAFDYCLPVAWSNIVDFKSHILIVVLLCMLPSWNAANVALPSLAIAVGALRTIAWLRHGKPMLPPMFSALDFVVSQSETERYARVFRFPPGGFDPALPENAARRVQTLALSPFYLYTVYRCGAVVIGAAVWLAIRGNTRLFRAVRRFPSLSLLMAALLWYAYFAGLDPSNYPSALVTWLLPLHSGFGRLWVSASVGLVVMVTCGIRKSEVDCADAPLARAVRNFLGFKPFVWLSRSTYSIYLSHPIAGFSLAALPPRLTKEAFTHRILVLAGLRWYLIAVVVSVPLCIAEEVGLQASKKLTQWLFGPPRKSPVTGAGQAGKEQGDKKSQ